MRIEDAGLETEWFRALTARVTRRYNQRGVQMLRRFRVWLGRLLIGPNFKVVRDSALIPIFEAATRLRSYVDQSGALQERSHVYAYHVVKREADVILAALQGAEVRL